MKKGKRRCSGVNVKLGKITSSPDDTPAVERAVCSAAVPLLTAIAYFAFTKAANSFSNNLAVGPFPEWEVNRPLFKILTTS